MNATQRSDLPVQGSVTDYDRSLCLYAERLQIARFELLQHIVDKGYSRYFAQPSFTRSPPARSGDFLLMFVVYRRNALRR